MEGSGTFKVIQPKNPDLYLAELLLRYEKLFMKNKGSFYVALAGGKTPLKAYSLLAKRLKTKAFLSDERYVPLDSEKSNYKNIKETGLDVIPFPTHLDIEQCAITYSQVLPEHLDLALLGIGEDGHTASLFPNLPCQEVTHKVCISVSPDGMQRISLSYEYLNRSCIVVFYVKNKSKVIESLLKGDPIPPNRIRGKRKTLLVWSSS